MTGNTAIHRLDTVASLRAWTAQTRRKGRRIALVPTMGALHEGHLALVREGLKSCDEVVASIFVNPAQFGPREDFSAYPRTLEADVEKLAAAGAQAVFHPAVSEIYPPGFATAVTVEGVSAPLEGACRPGHFSGVATVVTKLLLQALPDVALFGEKDWQQLQVIRRLAADLDMPVKIEGVPTVRDARGLALSSRNAYLSAAQYEIAAQLNVILFAMASRLKSGEDPASVAAWGEEQITQKGFDSIDYLAIRDAATLQEPANGPLRILAAVRLGPARLIDNVPA